MSVNVQVTPSVTQNPNHHDNNNKIAIDIHYTNYIQGVFDESVSFELPIEDGITWDNIFGTECSDETESECRFEECVEEYLEELEVDYIARPMAIEAIAKGYLDMKDTRVVGSSCLRALSVVVEINEIHEEVQGLTNMDLDQDNDNDDSDGDGANDDDVINDHNGMDANEIRAFLETCGVSFSRVSSSEDSCAICLETMEETEVARLPCNHVFHGDCVVEMVLKGGATYGCPLCRMELIAVQS